jgi:uncharacterized protein (TIGR02301 family)
MIRFARLAIAATLLAALAGPAAAQSPPASEAPAAPGYEAELLRLSEILGAVQFLRELCGTQEGSLWRDQMQALLDSEQPTLDRRARMVDRFNRGYESYRSVYRTCTESARLTVDNFMQEGARISAEIAARYGNHG